MSLIGDNIYFIQKTVIFLYIKTSDVFCYTMYFKVILNNKKEKKKISLTSEYGMKLLFSTFFFLFKSMQSQVALIKIWMNKYLYSLASLRYFNELILLFMVIMK